ncbi:MAG: hypothetical protein ACJAWL_001557 [Motiliproteus sp.]|jgi:hypothetical protein
MKTKVELSVDGRYVLVTQQGQSTIAQMEATRIKSLPLYNHCDRMLVDCRQSDISHLAFIELDSLAASFKKAVPPCIKAAFVKTPGADDRMYAHLANTYSIFGVESEIFETLATARDWLLDDH